MGKLSHEERMQKKQEVMNAAIERADKDKGLIVVVTGPGKAKSSSGFGMVARSLGHGMKVGVVQFIKGAIPTGEEKFYRRFPDEVEYHVVGGGYTWDTQSLEKDIEMARKGWDIAKRMLSDPSFDVVLFDELNIVLKYGYLELDEVIADLTARPAMQHVIITGRYAPKEIIEIGDTVSDVQVVKHAFRDQGIRAQPGIEL